MSAAQKDITELVAACDRTREEFAGHLAAVEAQGVWVDRGYQIAQRVRPWLKWLMPIGALFFRKRKKKESRRGGLGRLFGLVKTGMKVAPVVWKWWRSRE